MQSDVATVGITAASLLRVTGFFLSDAMRGKHHKKITIQTGAKRGFIPAAINATDARQIFSGTANAPNAVNICVFRITVLFPKIDGDNRNRRNAGLNTRNSRA